MRTCADYDRAIDVVRHVIHGWDPYDLLRGGAPADEWDGEIARLVARVPSIASPADATAAISSVFSEAFQPSGFALADCVEVGQQLYSALRDANLLTHGT